MKTKYNKLMISIILILSVFIAGCSYNTYENSNLINCEVGKYGLSENVQKFADRNGWSVDYIEIEKATNYNEEVCNLYLVFDEPIVQFGSEVYSMTIHENCNIENMQSSKEDLGDEYNDATFIDWHCN